jgi:acyl transferase domain-containing protein/acyl carrier protein/NAD(P)-dependent dehydrogenase (short-subunit alcohol dehydrogenase family)
MSTNRQESESGAVAIVGVGAILPDAPDAHTFWENLKQGRYSISDVTDRWAEDLYFDPDPAAPDMTYSKIGGWCRDYEWNPLGWRMPIPPKVSEVMDPAQKWAVAATREALMDYGYPERPLDQSRTAVIVGNALGGDFHLRSASRILFPEINDELKKAPSFQELAPDVQHAVLEELVAGVRSRIPDITEDTMPGELGNIVAGRVAALFDFKGPNYITDAACASAMAGMSAAVEGLRQHDYDAVVTGGIDANMSASTFVKFCKIGALSGTGTRPYAEGADGFVMGEGAAVFLMKRLEDAERDGDRIYAVLLGMGGSSDGKGKGITAPNPVGQLLAEERGWERAGVAPSAGDMIEGHGTSTKVGDVVEVESLSEAFSGFGLPVGSLSLGSVKSNIGHLKGAAGAAGVLKATLALHHKQLPPSVNFHSPNPNIDFSVSPLAVNPELRPWDKPGANGDGVRRAGVSAFGFGGTNFHLVMEEYVPGRHRERRAHVQGANFEVGGGGDGSPAPPAKKPLRGALVVGGQSESEIAERLRAVKLDADAGTAPAPAVPREVDLRAPVRVVIDYGDADELADLAGKALKALEEGKEGRWRALRNKGVFLGRGAPGKVAFLFPGQGSQYVDMLKDLRDVEPIVAQTFREADKVMTPLLDGPLTAKIFVESDDEAAREQAERDLTQTAVTQPAVLTVDTALCRLYAAYGIEPDLVMGHSLGEYGALVAAGGIAFADALSAVAARGEAMTGLSLDDQGLMAAVFGPVDRVQEILDTIDGYVVVANINSTKECVIGGASDAVTAAMEALKADNVRVAQLSVSHAFHTRIVEPAAAPLMTVLGDLELRSPHTPVVANVDASFYPSGEGATEKMIAILGRQIGSPVQFVKGLEKLYDAGARVFVEMGPKRALYALAGDVVGGRDGVTVLYTNHSRVADVVAANRALCGMYAEGLGRGVQDEVAEAAVREVAPAVSPVQSHTAPVPAAMHVPAPPAQQAAPGGEDRYVALGRMFADFLDKSFETYSGGGSHEPEEVRVGITGASLGLPGERVFAEDNLERILAGEQFIVQMPEDSRQGMLDRRITRLVKGSNGEARFETIVDPTDVIKLAGRGGRADLVEEFGFPEDRMPALDRVTQLAIGAGLDALRDAGIPLVMRYRSTTTGSKLPVGWSLPEEMRDDTGVVFGSAFPGYDYLIRILDEFHEDRSRREALAELEGARDRVSDADSRAGLDERIAELKANIDEKPYEFDRRFLFQVLSMGHSQFAEYIGARGPNTQVNGACATGMQAVTVARDWIETGRCRRVIVITADDVTTEAMFPWYSSGFLASGAAATDASVEDAALPFDKRRHGLIFGMGAAALVLEDMSVAAERGVWPICEVMGSVIANSAFHGSRLDVDHIRHVMDSLVRQVEDRWSVSRYDLARDMVFVSHETYTPARGGSAGAEVEALRHVFGSEAERILVANTKGFTGHPMAVALEEVLTVKMLETGIVPPVANFRDVDPDLGPLNLSRGGSNPVQYALRLGAGFGSQISMSIMRWTPPPDGARRSPTDLGFQHRISDQAAWSAWLSRATGYPQPHLEVVQRTLRVKDEGPPVVEPASRAATQMGVSPVPAAVRPTAAVSPPPVVAAPAPAVPAPVVPPQSDPTPQSDPQPPATVEEPVQPAAESGAPEGAPMDVVAARVLQIVSEQTGYPADMLALDLDLEADLGIDTVKQAEMFAAIRAEYDIERDENVALRDYPTLARAIEFVFEKRPDLEPGAGPVGSTDAAAEVADTSAEDADALTVGAGDRGDASASIHGAVAQRVLEIVSEQTGYPSDMLDLDLDLEADLGIDTVKQAEMFAAIRAEYGIERDENVALRDYPTLARAIEFVFEKRPDLEAETEVVQATEAQSAAAQPAEVAAPVAPAARAAADTLPAAGPAIMGSVARRVLEIVAEQTGYPPDMLELDLDLEADLGIDTVKQAEMFAAIRSEYGIERDENLALRDYPTLGRAIDFVFEKRPELIAATAEEEIAPAVEPVESTAGALAEGEPVAAVTSDATDPVAVKVLQIVCEQTGYPSDMLELELDLEADLGIDTVKQAEMFAAIREAYGIERDENVALRDYPTLAHAIGFVYERRPDLQAGTAVAESTEAPAGPDAPAEPVAPTEPVATAERVATAASGSMEAAQSVPRRVPVPRIRPPLDRFPGTGIDIGDGSRVIIVPDEGGVGSALAERLTKKGAEVLVADPSQTNEALAEELHAFSTAGPLTGMYWLPAMDPVLPAELVDPADRREAIRRRVKSLHGVMRSLYGQLGNAGTFFISGVRLGGYHGYDEAGATDVVGGAVAGYTKAFFRERPDALVKTVDFEPSRKTTALARVLLNETLRDPGAVEVGYAADQRWCVGLQERPVEVSELEGVGAVYVVTGAAGSIVSAIITDLAEAGGGTFWLLDLAEEPNPDNEALARLTTDPDGLRRDIFQRLQATEERATPVQVERELAGLEREAAAVAAMQAIRDAGGEAHYRRLDLRDPEAVGGVMAEVLEAHGRVDVLIHAAGLEISRSIPKKSQEEFELVFDVKAEGWYNLMAGLGEAPLGAAVVFSSIAGRFGNAGQVDYSAANDLLCKAVSELRRTRPETYGISIDWTAWRDIGMAARGSIPSIMKAAGIDMLPPEAGIPIVRRELAAGSRGEVVIAQALGVMLEEDADRTALDDDFVAGTTTVRGPMTGRVRAFRIHGGLVVDTELDPAEQPFLQDHRIGGTPVLPGVMGIEAMAEAARIPFPDRHLTAMEDVAFNAPFKFYRDEPRTVTVEVAYGQDGADIVADCRLVGSRQLVGHDEPEVTVHFTGRVRLAPVARDEAAVRDLPELAPEVVSAPTIYETFFHGPAYQVLRDAWRVDGVVAGRFAEEIPPNHHPEARPTLAYPRLVELAFQTAGLAEIAGSERMGLPAALEHLELHQPGGGAESGASAVVRRVGAGRFDVDVTDAEGRIVVVLKGYRTSALPEPVKADAFRALRG